MATTFNYSVGSSGRDATSLVTAESSLDEDLTAATIKVFAVSSKTGVIADGDLVIGNTSTATGVCVHSSVGNQILIKTIAVASFQSGETVQKVGDASKNVVLGDNGDSPTVRITVYSNLTSGCRFSGGTYDATHYIAVWGNNASWDGTEANAVSITVSGQIFLLSNTYVEIAYLLLINTIDTSNNDTIGGSTAYYTIHHNLFKRVTATYNNSYNHIRNSDNANTGSKIYNNIFYGGPGLNVIGSAASGTALSIYNNTMDSTKSGVGGSGSGFYFNDYGSNYYVNFSNNIIVNASDALYPSGSHTVRSYNVTDINDTSLNGTGDVVSSTAINLDANYFPQATSTDVIDVGTNLGSPYDLDISNYTRTGTWDKGAKEYIATGGATGFMTTNRGYWG